MPGAPVLRREGVPGHREAQRCSLTFLRILLAAQRRPQPKVVIELKELEVCRIISHGPEDFGQVGRLRRVAA